MTIEILLLALTIGFTHAFEADHLVAVGNIVTRRNSLWLSIKDGIFWGLGHTSIIFLVSAFFLLSKMILNENDFRYFEALVGVMLLVLGFYRLIKLMTKGNEIADQHTHSMAYGIGAVHGLAGSGAVILGVLTQIKGEFNGLVYIIIFGLGSILGMMVAAGVFSIPFSVKMMQKKWFTSSLSILSALLCIALGCFIIFENIV